MIDETPIKIMQKLLEKTPTNCVLYFDQKFVKAIIDLHFFFDDMEKVFAWLTIDNPNLGGIAPIRLINIGKGEKVYQFIDCAIERSDQNEEVNLG